MARQKICSRRIPKRKITIFTGVSGSGKSSIVFDTLANESQRLLSENFSLFLRSFMPHYPQPDADALENLSMAVVIDHKRLGGGSHSTLGTITDVTPVLRLLFCGLGRPPGGIMIESLHGAPKDADAPPGAVAFRRASFNVSALAVWNDPLNDAEQIDWARESAEAVEPWSFSGGGYVNYMQADEPIERVRAAFGAETFDRLQRLKRQYDPRNVLHRNQNIPPL